MRKSESLKAIFIFTIVFLFFGVGNTIAGEWKVWDTQTSNDPFKTWTIEFNQPLKVETINIDSIYVYVDGDTQNRMATTITIKDGTSVVVSPNEQYSYNQVYTLVIDSNVQSENGASLEREIQMPFVIIDDNTSQEPVKGHNNFVIGGLEIGDSEEKVLDIYGEPIRRDLSKYGFYWNIYHQNYENYLQVGIHSGQVVALYTNQNLITSKDGITLNSNKSEVRRIFGEPETSILKGNTRYNQHINDEYDLYSLDNYYTTIFYDNHREDQITSIQLIEKGIEESFLAWYGQPSEELRDSFEVQMFDIVNSTRFRFGLPLFELDDRVVLTSRNHSIDMGENDYFDHTNLEGESPFDRMIADGITYSTAAENISYGYSSPIFSHEGLMNSAGHRRNLLNSNLERLGIGVGFNDKNQPYYTQKFITPFSW